MTVKSNNCWVRTVKLDSGRFIQFFANKETGLVCVDVVAPNESGGCEVARLDANKVDLGHCE